MKSRISLVIFLAVCCLMPLPQALAKASGKSFTLKGVAANVRDLGNGKNVQFDFSGTLSIESCTEGTCETTEWKDLRQVSVIATQADQFFVAGNMTKLLYQVLLHCAEKKAAFRAHIADPRLKFTYGQLVLVEGEISHLNNADERTPVCE